MAQEQGQSMKCLARKLRCAIILQPRRSAASAIVWIAQARMADRREMYSNLMGAAGKRHHTDQRGIRAGHLMLRQNSNLADCGARMARMDRHPLAFGWMTSNRPRDCEPLATHPTAHDCEVNLARRAILELARKL